MGEGGLAGLEGFGVVGKRGRTGKPVGKGG